MIKNLPNLLFNLLLRREWQYPAILLISAGSIVPFISLAFFSHPSADDYVFATDTTRLGFWVSQVSWYDGWTGRYFSSAILTLYNLIFHLKGYSFAILFLIFFFMTSIYFFIGSICGSIFRRTEILVATLVLLNLFISGMPDICSGVYWLSGAATYLLGSTLAIFSIGLLLSASKEKSHLQTAVNLSICSAAAVAAIGCNETIMIIILPVFFSGSMVTAMLKSHSRAQWIFITIIGAIAAYIVISAPGNKFRAAFFPDRHQGWLSIHFSLRTARYYFTQWVFDSRILVSTFLLLPFAFKISKEIEFFRNHWQKCLCLVFLWMMLIPLSFFPAFWAMGHTAPDRTINTIYLLFLLGWFPSIVVLVTVFLGVNVRNWKIPQELLSIATILYIVCLTCQPNNLTKGTRELLTQAYPYHKEILRREKLVANALEQNSKDLVVPSISHRPSTIFFTDLKSNPGSWINRSYAEYWGLASIRTEGDLSTIP